METTHRQQLAQELVEYIITFLHNFPPELLTCALVSRSWVYRAQSHIFSLISFVATESKNEQLWERLRVTFQISPHLIRHVRHLEINNQKLSTPTFAAICNFLFTHWDGVSFARLIWNPSCAFDLQQLLSLPTLRRVLVAFCFTNPTSVLQMWDRCSPGMRHLELRVNSYQAGNFQPSHSTHHLPSLVRLESFRIIKFSDVDWLIHTLQPFDLSQLRCLSMPPDAKVLHSPNFVCAIATIETLDLVLQVRTNLLPL